MSDRRGPAIPADDSVARERALDVRRSFVVQAPAGSGKTELLIQRFLALLGGVDRPERIVAMTFTRKAAGEMRERIVGALRDARAGAPVASPHAQRTRDLALAALAQDERQGWALDAHPARLAVFTIDALAAGLARQAPLAARLGALPRYEERAAPLYAHAVQTALADAAVDDAGWRRLLAHLDNDATRAVKLLADMLAKRDQWLDVLRPHDRSAFRAMLEASLAAEITGELATVAQLFPPHVAAALAEHQRYAATHLTGNPDAAALAEGLDACAAAGGLPPPTVAGRERWLGLARWLLVGSDARFRARVNRNDGFPAKGSDAGSDDRQQRNEAMTSLLRELDAVPGLAEALDTARCLPPARYADDAWAIVDALLDVLPRVAGELTLTFRDAGAIDFTQGTLAALEALGEDGAPSDLLQKLDLRILHLLVDEFQDTSFIQLALIRRLTTGWERGDGRTLFAVGDPMQSIYRFRGAEVLLFVEAQERGCVGELPVDNLVLTRNFRSQAGLVQWVNAVFPHVLSSRSDAWRGTVGFAPANPTRDPVPGPAATLDVLRDTASEAQTVVDRVQTALGEHAPQVAILVRARAHLEALLPALRAAGIAFAAVELDMLAERQAVLDLASLTHALVQPADRHAWLAVLRAPWCGLCLPDLFAVTAAADAQHDGFLGSMLDIAPSVPGLSDDGRARLARVASVLAPVQAARGRAGVAARVRGAWLALGGPATLDEPIDIDAAERFLALLAEFEVAGDVADWPAFVDALARLPAASDAGAGARVQVMTLHRAKGLEFDTVILPGLARAPKRGGTEVLRWRRRRAGLLLAPMKPQGGAEDPVYAYLKKIAGAEEAAELARLLYVGCTRAKRRLHLTAVLDARATDGQPAAWVAPPTGSALAKFWNAPALTVGPPPATAAVAETTRSLAQLVRLPSTWAVPAPGAGVPVAATPSRPRESPPFDWAREAARHTGTVAHRLFAQVAREGIASWSPQRVASLGRRIRLELSSEGVDDAELDGAAAAVAAAIDGLLADARGRWLFDPGHRDATSEWALAGIEADTVAHIVIDRSFVADGVRWIVDFKTGTHEGADVAAFLDDEVERYRDQLARYARFVAAIDPRPIRLALYHPRLAGWREWSPSSSPQSAGAAEDPEIR